MIASVEKRPFLCHVGSESGFLIEDPTQNILVWRTQDHVGQLPVFDHTGNLPGAENILRKPSLSSLILKVVLEEVSPVRL